MSGEEDNEPNFKETDEGPEEAEPVVLVPQCKLKRFRYQNEEMVITKSHVGGGKLCRESHIASMRSPNFNNQK